MPFPKTLDALREAGYKFQRHTPCRGCLAMIEWWLTPNSKYIPMDIDAHGKAEPHWASCPKAAEFRREKV